MVGPQPAQSATETHPIELRLTRDGWEVAGGELKDPVPLSVEMAYEMADFDQRVLDETRKLCGDLRFPAKKNRRIREDLEALRASLQRARALKASRAAPDQEKR